MWFHIVYSIFDNLIKKVGNFYHFGIHRTHHSQYPPLPRNVLEEVGFVVDGVFLVVSACLTHDVLSYGLAEKRKGVVIDTCVIKKRLSLNDILNVISRNV